MAVFRVEKTKDFTSCATITCGICILCYIVLSE